MSAERADWFRVLVPEAGVPAEKHALPSEEIPLAKIRSDAALNSRSGDLDINGLAESMGSLGLMQPIVVARESDPKTGTEYRLVAGFRRTAAAAKLGWKTIPAVIVNADVEQARIFNLAENLSRKNLRLYDTMRTVYDLSEKRGIQTNRIARDIGFIKESRVASMIKVWPKLSPTLKEKWSQIPDPSWEPTMHQLTQWSALSYPEQMREWLKWANDESEPGTDFDEDNPFAKPEDEKKKGTHRRRKTSAIRGMIEALSDEKNETAKAQIRALLWALGERNTL
jgi:ParB/RepB/Spo0J family partition protein